MNVVPYSTKITKEQIETLKAISQQTHVPQAVLVREAISKFIGELSKSGVPKDFLKLMKNKIREDKSLLKKLAGT